MTTSFKSKKEYPHAFAHELIEAKVNFFFDPEVEYSGKILDKKSNVSDFFNQSDNEFLFIRKENFWIISGEFTVDLIEEINNNQICHESCFPCCLMGEIKNNITAFNWYDSEFHQVYGVKTLEEAKEKELTIGTYKVTTQEALNAIAEIIREHIEMIQIGNAMEEIPVLSPTHSFEFKL